MLARRGLGKRFVFATGLVLLEVAGSSAEESGSKAGAVHTCPTEPPAGAHIEAMNGNGWDGPGQNAATVYFHFEGSTADTNMVDQRRVILNALQAWANVVQITFFERAIPNANTTIDFNFLSGDHSAAEPQEAGDADCPFDGVNGTLAHAGFPPGVGSACPNILVESFAGNVHFDEAENWEDDDANGAGSLSLALVACHEIGHAIGLAHTSGSTDVMRPSFTDTEAFAGLSSADIANIRSGYAAGTGTVLPLENTGVWVDRNYGGPEEGTSFSPFNTIAEGIAGVPPASSNVPVIIQAGTYLEPLTITQAMRLVATNGTVTIGP